jgi:hypothetical protein
VALAEQAEEEAGEEEVVVKNKTKAHFVKEE